MEDKVEQTLRLTRELIRESRYEEAWQALWALSGNQKGLFMAAQIYFHQGAPEKHLEWISRFRQTNNRRRALQASLDFLWREDREEFLPEIYQYIGEQYLELDEVESALEYLSNSARLDPQRWQTQLALGQALKKKELHPEALAAFQIVLRLTQVQHPLVHHETSLWLAQFDHLEGGAAEGYQNPDKPAEASLEVARAQPEAEDLTTIGRLYSELGRYQEADLEFRTILRSDLSHIPALLGLGRVSLATGKWREAMLCFQRILHIEPLNRISSEHLAEVYLQKNMPDEAIKHYSWTAQGYLEDGQREQAVRIYRLVLTLDPCHPEALRQLVQLGEQPDPSRDS